MNHTNRSTDLHIQRSSVKSPGWILVKGLLMSGLWACNTNSSSNVERVQAENMGLTKTLHNHFNHHDWQAVERLCSETVRYRGRATQFAEVEESKTQFLARYRTTLRSERSGSLEIRQLYPAGAYHVIAEGMVVGDLPDLPLPVCLIYTIEHNHITRLYAY